MSADRLVRSGARHAEGMVAELEPAPHPPARRCPSARVGASHATPARDGADQRIADRIAEPRRRRLRPVQRAGRAAPRRRPDRGRDHRLAPDERAVARQRPPDPRGRRLGGVGRPRARLLAARGGGARLDRRAHGAAQPPLLRRVPRPARQAAPRGGPRRRADDRHRPVQEAQRHVRARRGRPRAARGRPGDRRGRPRGRRPGPVRRRGVRGAAAQPEPRDRGRGRGARPARRRVARPAPARRARA